MTDCIDTFAGIRPLESVTVWLFRGLLKAARVGDRMAGAVLVGLIEWRWRASQRDILRSLDDRMLKDVGLSRADLEHELRKPFWQL